MNKPKYSMELDCTDRECSRFEPRWANYGYLCANGNTLEELLDTASIDIMDQDGGELDVVPADSPWMQDLIGEEYWRLNGKVRSLVSKETFPDFLARMEREGAHYGED